MSLIDRIGRGEWEDFRQIPLPYHLGGVMAIKNVSRRKGTLSKVRPSGHNIKPSFGKVDSGGPSRPTCSSPSLLLKFGNKPAANDLYSERYLRAS